MKKKLLIIFGLVLGVFSITFFTCKNFLSHAYKTPDNNPNMKEKTKIKEEKETVDDNIKEDVIENEDELNNNTSPDENTLENEVPMEDDSTNKEENTKTETSTKENNTTQSKPSTNTTTTNKNTTTESKKTETNTSSNASTNSKTNTNTNTNTSTTTEPKKTLVKTEEVTERELKSEKYGTKFYNEKHYTVSTYSDDTTKKELSFTISNVMDVSGFNGTAASMMDEAKALVEANRETYNELLAIVNGYRAEKGASPLELDENLTIAATIRAMEMAYTNDMNHQRPNGSSCFDIFEELGVPPMYTSGENIAAGYFTPQLVANGWKNSAGHYRNMVDPNFKKIGLGMMRLQGTTYGIYWAQMFTS